MKLIICLALLTIISCSITPLGTVRKIIKLIERKRPVSLPDLADITVSVTYYADEASKTLTTSGSYNLIDIIDGQPEIDTDTLDHNVETIDELRANITGSGLLTIRGNSDSMIIDFFGAFTSDFTAFFHGSEVIGTSNHQFSGKISLDDANGHVSGTIDASGWRGRNSTRTHTSYEAKGDWMEEFQDLHGKSTAVAHTTNSDSQRLKSVLDATFIGVADTYENTYQVSGDYDLTIFDSSGAEIANRTGHFSKNGSFPNVITNGVPRQALLPL